MSQSTVYAKQVMEDLDALLADLQSTTAHISYSNQGPPLAAGPPSQAQNPATRGTSSGRANQQHPLTAAPPPQDLPDTISPPQQFDDQPLYEPQNVRRDVTNRHSSSSRSSQGSAEIPYHSRDQYSQNTQYQQRPGSRSSQGSGSGEGSYYGREPTQRYQQQQQQYQHYTPGQQQQQHPHQEQQGMSMISNNLSELDQLLSDLNSAQFMAEVDKKHAQTGGKQPLPQVAPKPSRGGGNISVDSLLDQLEGSAPAGNQGQMKSAYNGTQNQNHVGQGNGHAQQNTYAEAQQGAAKHQCCHTGTG